MLIHLSKEETTNMRFILDGSPREVGDKKLLIHTQYHVIEFDSIEDAENFAMDILSEVERLTPTKSPSDMYY